MCSIIPNALPREEFLIVLEYLLKFTNDKKNASSQVKIINYAKEEYNVDIRRERIGQILDHLYELYCKYPNKFPFKLECKELNQTKKYFISRRNFDDDTIINICHAIENNVCFSEDISKELADKFLDAESNEYRKPELRKKIEESNNNIDKMSHKNSVAYLKLSSAKSENKLINFKIIDARSVASNDMNKYHQIAFSPLCGYVYCINKFGDNIKVVIYLTKSKIAIVTRIDNIELTQEPINFGNNNVSFKLESPEYKTIDEWLKSHYSGKDGKLINITFKFETDYRGKESRTFRLIEKTFRLHFKEELKATEIEQVSENDNKKEYQASVLCNIESFKKWYYNYEILNKVTVTGPSSAVNDILKKMTDVLNRRLKEYGEE